LGDDFNPDQHIDDFLKAVKNKLNKPARPTKTSNPNQQPTIFDNQADSSSNSSSNNYLPANNNQEPKSFIEKY